MTERKTRTKQLKERKDRKTRLADELAKNITSK